MKEKALDKEYQKLIRIKDMINLINLFIGASQKFYVTSIS